jgi:hypothetical protein
LQTKLFRCVVHTLPPEADPNCKRTPHSRSTLTSRARARTPLCSTRRAAPLVPLYTMRFRITNAQSHALKSAVRALPNVRPHAAIEIGGARLEGTGVDNHPCSAQGSAVTSTCPLGTPARVRWHEEGRTTVRPSFCVLPGFIRYGFQRCALPLHALVRALGNEDFHLNFRCERHGSRSHKPAMLEGIRLGALAPIISVEVWRSICGGEAARPFEAV